jgi:hypothetical protein
VLSSLMADCYYCCLFTVLPALKDLINPQATFKGHSLCSLCAGVRSGAFTTNTRTKGWLGGQLSDKDSLKRRCCRSKAEAPELLACILTA